MEFKEILELIKLVNKSNLTEFKMKEGEFSLSIRTKKYGRLKGQQIMAPQQQIVPVQASIPTAVQVPAAVAPVAPAAPTPAATSNAEAEDTSKLVAVKSPIVGTFYRAPSPDKPPYIKVGDHIDVGQVVCIVEAMKLFNEIESEVSGRIVEVVIDDASPVEYDQVLYMVDPNG